VPELPEVETVRRQLAPQLEGATVVDAGAFPSAKFTEAVEVVGTSLGAVGRRGKYLLVGLDDDRELVVHLGMTGRLAVEPAGPPPSDDGPHLRAWWRFDDGRRLTFHDVRRFGRIAVVPAGDHRRLATLHALGPEPWDADFTAEGLRRSVVTSRRALKTLLLSQRAVAGVGNIYADEALWLAGVHPLARRLSRDRADALHAAIRQVLSEGIADGGTTLRDYRDALGGEGAHQERLRCYGRAGLPCRRCGRALRRGVVDGRTTTWCPSCQRR
jgi:formamidopyrimidine-DNA glycosylase